MDKYEVLHVGVNVLDLYLSDTFNEVGRIYSRDSFDKFRYEQTGLINSTDPLVTNDVSSYLVYTALLTQREINDPTAVELKNTLGAVITLKRKSEGVYKLQTFDELFDANITVYQSGVIAKYIDGSYVELYKDGYEFSILSFTGDVPSDNVMINTPIEIKVYPSASIAAEVYIEYNPLDDNVRPRINS